MQEKKRADGEGWQRERGMRSEKKKNRALEGGRQSSASINAVVVLIQDRCAHAQAAK